MEETEAVNRVPEQTSPQKKDLLAHRTPCPTGFQTIGAAFMQSGVAAASNNQLLLYLPKTAPEVDPSAVVAVGATELESFGSSLHGARIAYMNGLNVAFATFLCFHRSGLYPITVLSAQEDWRGSSE
jgi:hypothetical protein